MPFCNVDFELEGKYAASSMKRFTTSEVFQRYIEEPAFVIKALQLLRESASYPFFEQLFELEALQSGLASKQGCGYQTLLLLYAVTILSERFFDTPPDVQDLIEELHLLLNDCPDCPEKISSYILLADYYHYNFRIEEAWKRIYLATSIGYALGLHRTPSKIWTMLVFQDSLLCSILGRPTSISKINPKLIHDCCDGWGEIALLLRDFNNLLLDLESENSIEKVICLEMKCDNFVERTRNRLHSSDTQSDQQRMLLEYLKLLIMVSSQVKLLFPLFSKHRLIQRRLDENCSSLAFFLCELFQYLTENGLATKEKLFKLRPHFFPAYCCIFQAFLFQFLFTSSMLLKAPVKGESGSEQASISKYFINGNLTLSSLSRTLSLLNRFDYVADKMTFCAFMKDVFESFRALFYLGTDGKSAVQILSEDTTGQPTYEKALPPCDEMASNSQDVPSPFTVEDIADWITSCFPDGVPYSLPAEYSP